MYTRGGDQNFSLHCDNELAFFLDTVISHYYRCMHFYFYSTKSKMFILLPTFIYQYRISHWAILIRQRRMKVCYIALLWDTILCQSFVFSFEVYAGVISTPVNHIPPWASQNVIILYVGILKCSKMYITSTTHLNMTSLSSWIVYSSQSTFQTFKIVISVHKGMHIFLFIDLNL